MKALWQRGRWQVVLPELLLTPTQLAIVDREPGRDLDQDSALDLIEAYRRTRSALWQVGGSRGFRISFAVGWQPDNDAVGEPETISHGADGTVVHVFGRSSQDTISPSLAMGQRRRDRSYISLPSDRVAMFAAAMGDPSEVAPEAPSDRECDGCRPDVLSKQERWRADGVRVIRPRDVLIDSQVIVLPLRHVVSLGDLDAQEVISIAARLGEVRHQFGLASGVTGLSCFANDGTAARQETPHVHLHVFGRSRDEPVNPFELLGRRIAPR